MGSPPRKAPLPLAARHLTRKQQLFSQLCATNPGEPKGKLASLAGYSNKDPDRQARELLRDPRIIAAIRAFLEELHELMPVAATGIVDSLVRGDFTDPKRATVQLAASKLALGLGRMAPATQINVKQETTVVHEMSVDQALAEIQKLGFGLRKDAPTIEHEPAPKQIEHRQSADRDAS